MNRRKFLSYVGCSCCGYLLPSCTTAHVCHPPVPKTTHSPGGHSPARATFGGTAAGPVFKEVATYALQELGVTPDKELPKKVLAARAARLLRSNEAKAARDAAPHLPELVAAEADPEGSSNGWLMPDLRGLSLRDVARVLVPTGAQVELQGSGLVTEQEPMAGESFSEGQVVTVALGLGSKSGSKRQ